MPSTANSPAITPREPGKRRLTLKPWWWLAAAIIILAAFAMRHAHHLRGGQPDEIIAIAVVSHLRQSGDWDTNWAKTELEPGLRYDQYNFSSYHFALYFFYRLAKLVPAFDARRSVDAGVALYRFFSVMLGTVVVGQAMGLARRLGNGAAGLGAGVLVGAAPLLVQDAHFIRPEAFVTVLTLAAVTLAWPHGRWARARAVTAAFVVGLLIACKVSMLLLAWLPFLPLVVRWSDLASRWWVLAAVPPAMLAGFAAGAPGAIAQPEVFLHGVRYLAAQYAGAHPPHSHYPVRPVADMLVGYFAATLGWPVVIGGGLGAAFLAWRRRWPEFLLLAGSVAVFAGFFATRSVFFERNLSHILPLMLILAAYGITAGVSLLRSSRAAKATIPILAVTFAALAATPAVMTWRLVAGEISGRGSMEQEEFEMELRSRHAQAQWHAVTLLTLHPLDDLTGRFAHNSGPVLLRVTDYYDDWTASHLPQLAQRFEVQPVASRPGPFSNVPTCTLHTYHRAHERYFLVTGLRVTAPGG